MPDISNVTIPIIIVNWKGVHDTLECMNSVFNLTHPFYKIYLVDNYSNDGSVEILKKKFQSNPKVELIFNNKNLGFTKANNEVFRLILKDEPVPNFIALLNNDTIVEPNWLSSLIEVAEEHNAAIVASKMIDYYDRRKIDNAGHLMLNTGEILPIAHGKPVSQYNNIVDNVGACAGACLYSSEMLQDIGLFDEYFTTGYEDAELGVRAMIAGYKSVYDPRAIVYHKMGSSIKKVFNYEYALSIQKKILYTYLKLIPTANLLMNLPFIILRYSIILLVQLLLGRFTHFKIILQAIKEIFIDDITAIKKSRNDSKKIRKLSSLAVSRQQTFFLTNNLKRFYQYYIQKNQSALDTYGKKELV